MKIYTQEDTFVAAHDYRSQMTILGEKLILRVVRIDKLPNWSLFSSPVTSLLPFIDLFFRLVIRLTTENRNWAAYEFLRLRC